MSDLSNVARPYAQAVFELAHDAGDLADWSDQLELLSVISADASMLGMLKDPAFSSDQRINVVLDVAGDKLSESAKNLVRLLVANGRVPALPDIAKIYGEKRAQAESVVEANMITASEIDQNQQQAFAESLKKRLGRNVQLSFDVDESLIGGAVIRAGDWVIDGSVKAQLEQLEGVLAA